MDPFGHSQAAMGRRPVGPAGACNAMAKLTAKDVMQYGVVNVEKTEPVHRAVALLFDKGISALPVTAAGRLVGMISERDLLRAVHQSERLSGQIGDYMTAEVVCLDVDDSFPTISTRLVHCPFRRVPVLLHGRTLAGIITRADLIRVYRDRLDSSTAAHPCESRRGQLVEDAMKRGLITLSPDASLCDAMNLILRWNVTGLPVVDGQMTLVGIITERDVLNHCLHSFPPEAAVAEVMTADVVAFDCKADLNLICGCLVEKEFHKAPLVDQGRLVGIVSRSDILRSKAAAFRQ